MGVSMGEWGHGQSMYGCMYNSIKRIAKPVKEIGRL